jgi:hypothetical protein
MKCRTVPGREAGVTGPNGSAATACWIADTAAQ